jgi:hypothetical protein
MSQLVARALGIANNEIQVSGLAEQEYPELRWKEAILFYLFGVWSNRESVMYRPKISFGDITLRLDISSAEYYAYGHQESPREDVPPLGANDLVVTSARQSEVEVGLIRFVKNPKIRQLRLTLETHDKMYLGTLVFWKKAKRGEYGVAGLGLPYTWTTRGPVWTREEYERQ